MTILYISCMYLGIGLITGGLVCLLMEKRGRPNRDIVNAVLVSILLWPVFLYEFVISRHGDNK